MSSSITITSPPRQELSSPNRKNGLYQNTIKTSVCMEEHYIYQRINTQGILPPEKVKSSNTGYKIYSSDCQLALGTMTISPCHFKCFQELVLLDIQLQDCFLKLLQEMNAHTRPGLLMYITSTTQGSSRTGSFLFGIICVHSKYANFDTFLLST